MFPACLLFAASMDKVLGLPENFQQRLFYFAKGNWVLHRMGNFECLVSVKRLNCVVFFSVGEMCPWGFIEVLQFFFFW